jgi:protocatechuate 3,4-dioxygenase beta subunit
MEPIAPPDPAPAPGAPGRPPFRTTRRAFLAGGVALAGLVAAGCSGDGDGGGGGSGRGGAGSRPAGTGTTVPDGPPGLTAADFDGLGPCRLAPEQTAGPFYADVGLTRRDITEGLPGHPLRLGVRVVDEDCRPVPGAVVEVWHCDVDGDYSAFTDGSGGAGDAGEGTTFLRGGQTGDDQGIVEFATNYPGWYTGRAVHIHARVRLDDGTALTTQLYFPDEISDEVHAEDPYAAHGERDTRNTDDGIAGDPAAEGLMLAATRRGAGTQGLIVLGVAR